MLDLGQAAGRMADLAAKINDDQLDRPTPSTDVSVGDLLDHIMALARAFRLAADKQSSAAEGPPPPASAANLAEDWRVRLPALLDELVIAWQAPEAWEGMTAAGGLELSGPEAGLVVLDELVLHGWDLAKGTGHAYDCDDASAEACYAFVSQIPPDDMEARQGLFGPPVAIPPDAPLFDRVLGLSGRDPAWKAG